MRSDDDRDREIAGLRERLSQLCEASFRINASLDLGAVLQGVLDSARSLTAARYGIIKLFDKNGETEDFLASGMTAKEANELWAVPTVKELYEYLRGFEEAQRIPDVLALARSMDLPAFVSPVEVGPVVPVLTAPIINRGEHLGHVFLAKSDGGQSFARDDEETLVTFTAQAALVIANARRHREEQKARADLETLINISPVGVAVFEGRTGEPISINREAIRIVDGLRQPGQSREDLLVALTCRRADGRQMSMKDLSPVEFSSVIETVRAEEVLLAVPGGRGVTVLINATPICSEDGEVESFVVTLQDMTPFEELELMRAEFLGMVSHELRAPLTSIKGSVTTLLETASELDIAEMRQFFQIIREQSDQMRNLIGDLLDRARIETGTLSVKPGPAVVVELVEEARRRVLNGERRDDLYIDLPPEMPLVMADHRRIVQVIGNLLSNAARNSSDGSRICVSADRVGAHIAVSITDQGRGLPAHLIPHLFRKFLRPEKDEQRSSATGSGLGLAICKGIVEAHGGRIWVESDGPGRGARFTFTVPVVEEAQFEQPARLSVQSRRAPRHRIRVLVVDDDPHTLRYIRDALSKANYAPIVTGDPGEVMRLVGEEKPHLVLLDLMLPGVNGIDLMKDILKTTSVPVIFVSAYGQEDVIAKAFDLGATDYVVKPFSPTELVARIRAALRKRDALAQPQPSGPYTAAFLQIDYADRSVNLSGHPVQLTPTEYAVIYELSVNAGRVLTYDQLLQRVWGPERTGEPGLAREVVKRLRQKLGDDAKNPLYIHTVQRVGYRMVKQLTA